jgi:aromatase
VPRPVTHYTDHHVTVNAPADVVFGLLADVRRWPQFFEPTIHAEQLEYRSGQERIQLWATANGEVRRWTSRRHLDAGALRIRFTQEQPRPPLESMGGEWLLKPLGEGQTRVELKHDFTVVDDAPDGVSWVTRAVDQNSTKELAAVSEVAAVHADLDRLMFSFTDEVLIPGPGEEVYEFLYAAAEWPRRIPHVDRLDLREPAPDVQEMEMVTRTRDGSTHTTTSVRLGFPPRRILYKQVRPPALLRAHSGSWTLAETPDGTVATSEHTVIIDPGAIGRVLTPATTIEEAGDAVRKALSTNSVTTLEHASAFVQGGKDG